MPKHPSNDRNMTAPVLPFDYPIDSDPIWPCHECLPWHVEVVTPDEGEPFVREWHAVGCSVLQLDEEG